VARQDPPAWQREERVALGDVVAPADDSRHFGALYEVGRKVLSAGSVEELNELALKLAFDCIRAERGALLLRDSESGEFVPRVLRSVDAQELAQDAIRIPTSIVREVLSGPTGILTTDALHDERFAGRGSVRVSNIRSALCAPLVAGDDVLGLIYLDSRLATYAFTRNDLGLLNAIANLIAIRLRQEALHQELTRERIVRSNLERYHSPDVVEAIMRGGGLPQIGLEERDVTVMFADLSGFTSLAEKESPARVADFLNEYYAVATRAIFDHGGTVNEYMGDGVMAIFGAPLAHPRHAANAVLAGIDLLRRVRAAKGIGEEGMRLHVRIGINSGAVVAGSVGSAERLKYAVIGDPVNVASRLEGVGRLDTITIGEGTYVRLDEDRPHCEDLGELQLKGREGSVRAYCIRP